MFACQRAVMVELGLSFWGCTPTPTPSSQAWCLLTVDPRDRGSKSPSLLGTACKDSNTITTTRLCAESFCHSIMFMPCDPSKQLDREPWSWLRPFWGLLHPSSQHWLPPDPQTFLRPPVFIPTFTPVLVEVTLPSMPVSEPEGPSQTPQSPGCLLV